MTFNNAKQILCATVTYFNGASVKHFDEFICFGETVICQYWEAFCEISAHVHTTRGIEPNDILIDMGNFLMTWGG